MRKLTICLVIVGLAATLAVAQGPSKQQELQAKGISNWSPGMMRGQGPVFGRVSTRFADGPPASIQGTTGTLQYDSGAITALPTVFGQIYGNQFNVTNGGGSLGGSLAASSFHFYFMEDDTGDTGLFFQPATFVNASMINGLASINIGGLANSGQSFSAPALNTVPWGALSILTSVFGSSNGVYLGAWCLNANTAFPVDNETIGLDTTLGSAGFKGYTASSGVGSQAWAAQSNNAVLRLTGTAPNIPVELMAFEVD